MPWCGQYAVAAVTNPHVAGRDECDDAGEVVRLTISIEVTRYDVIEARTGSVVEGSRDDRAVLVDCDEAVESKVE